MKDLEARYLERLSQLYPTIAKASTEIINLQAILNLPKGTEHFLTDIHGEYDAFEELLAKISFGDEDTLYILGDVLDRGPNPIKVMRKLMTMPNAICIAGNHEVMALECLEFLLQEISDKAIENLDQVTLDKLVTWQYNGASTTINEFRKLSVSEREDVIAFIQDFSAYEEMSVGEKEYLLVHAGLGNFSPEKDLSEYTIHDLVWDRGVLGEKYFDDVITITGHTPTMGIPGNPHPGYIFKLNNRIYIDCGACFPGGRLAAFCLDTGEEFYSSTHR